MENNPDFKRLTEYAVLGSVSSRLAKEQYLKTMLEDPVHEKIIYYALNPFKRFYMTNMPAMDMDNPKGELTTGHPIWHVLDQMTERAISGGQAEQQLKAKLADLSSAGQNLIKMVLAKDLRSGVSEKTVSKVKPNLIPSFDVMLAHKFEEKRIKSWPIAVQPKYDGFRAICFIKGDSAKFFYRSGKEYTQVQHLETPLVTAYHLWIDANNLGSIRNLGIILDGELMAGQFNETSSSLRTENRPALDAVYHIFDLIPTSVFYNNLKECIEPFTTRQHVLTKFCQELSDDERFKQVPTHMAHSLEEVLHMYDQFQIKGFEGAIVKPLEGTYQRKRSHNWMKMKSEGSVDIKVKGAIEGEGKYVGKLGALICNYKGVDVRVGGGFSDEQREEFWNNLDEIMDMTIEVVYHEITPDGSLRHPRFKRLRHDK